MDLKSYLQSSAADLAEAGVLTTAVNLDALKLNSSGNLDGTPNLLANIMQLQNIIDQSGSLANAYLQTLPVQSARR